MSDDTAALDNAALVRQVQRGIGVEYGADQLVYAIAALAELSERLETLEREDSAAWEDMRAYNLRLEERAWAAEAEVKRLREYYEANEAVERGVVDFDLHETAVLRLRAARAAIAPEEGAA